MKQHERPQFCELPNSKHPHSKLFKSQPLSLSRQNKAAPALLSLLLIYSSRMKGPIVFLTLALVIMSMAQPAEGFLHHIFRGIHGCVHGIVRSGQAQAEDQDAQVVFVDKRSADDNPGPDSSK
ncbi:hypothetical protein NQD34_017771 [Periophthalmus magnuspinnatus]|nr:hypothetical protein NQD34_017771 [Periophthalmus magnuspinnatus]